MNSYTEDMITFVLWSFTVALVVEHYNILAVFWWIAKFKVVVIRTMRHHIPGKHVDDQCGSCYHDDACSIITFPWTSLAERDQHSSSNKCQPQTHRNVKKTLHVLSSLITFPFHITWLIKRVKKYIYWFVILKFNIYFWNHQIIPIVYL